MGDEKKSATRKAPAKKAEKSADTATKTSLVEMIDDSGKTANVHPQEVENYRAGGFKEA